MNQWNRLRACAIFVLTAGSFAQAGPTDILDQSQEIITQLTGIPAFSPLGQSFIPSLNGVDFVELKLTDNTTAPNDGTTAVRIREDSIGGSILGTSETVFLEDCFNFPEGPGCGIAGGFGEIVRYEFQNTIPLIPGETYVLEVMALTSSFGVGNVTSDQYPLGTMIRDGIPDTGRDLWFREGLIPEPASILLLGAGTCVCLSRRRR
ncbi:MAG TPA: PEP-CTERM sorting domain-containing protein [Phycisphaerae bacterium]|nr:PEP-CTERM sorting domain-containing protein [Phycisphaerales bacterium]HNO77825.1 PEP-CTERM sorting domain-containing protein [Phycisphaerae bacterium]